MKIQDEVIENVGFLHEEVNNLKQALEEQSCYINLLFNALQNERASNFGDDVYYHPQTFAASQWTISTPICSDADINVYVRINGMYNQYRKVNPVIENVGGGTFNINFDTAYEGYVIVRSPFPSGDVKADIPYHSPYIPTPEYVMCWGPNETEIVEEDWVCDPAGDMEPADSLHTHHDKVMKGLL